MRKIHLLGICIITFLLIGNAYAQDERTKLKEYLNDAAVEVHMTEDPEEKREILDKLFHDLLTAFDIAEEWPLFSADEKNTIRDFRSKVDEKHDELNGYNGFERVPDSELNNFASYTVHNFEQAAQYVTISVVALLLIIILIVLLV